MTFVSFPPEITGSKTAPLPVVSLTLIEVSKNPALFTEVEKSPV